MVQSVVIVGGGIAGSSLAYALATAGVEVVVLEASVEFQDRVRGESMHLWGVAEARELGVEGVLLAAGAHVTPTWKQYMQGQDEPSEIPMSMMRPGIDGTMNLRHPAACQALLDAAVAAGATVARGVTDVRVSPGRPTRLSYRLDGSDHELVADLVVGADGRASTVRKQSGIELERDEAISFIAGLLLDGLDGVPDDHDVIVCEGDLEFLLFHQGNGRAHAYIACGLSGKHLFAGAASASSFLATTRLATYPWSAAVSEATPAGPCAGYAGDDTWTATPYAEGVVLVGDAAGHNDPIIGQGLSIALRDARSVHDIVLNSGAGALDFRPYAEERVERMRRLRFIADVLAVTHVEDGADNRAARRAYVGQKMAEFAPEVFPLLVGAFVGPETVPSELVDQRLLDQIRQA